MRQEIKNLPIQFRRYATPWDLESRELADQLEGARDNDIIMSGYAVKWDDEYEVEPGVFETIEEGAFEGAMNDVRFMVSHEGLALARQSSGTVAVAEDGVGLRFTAALDPRDSDAQTLAAKVERGAVTGVSVGFSHRGTVTRPKDPDDEEDRSYVITKVGELFEFSAVTFPAFEDTEIGVDRQDWYQRHRYMFPGWSPPVQIDPREAVPELAHMLHLSRRPAWDSVAVNATDTTSITIDTSAPTAPAPKRVDSSRGRRKARMAECDHLLTFAKGGSP